MNAIGQAARTVGGKALAVNIFPSPANLAESREVLRILQSYGEVTTYKLFKVGGSISAIENALPDSGLLARQKQLCGESRAGHLQR